MSQAGSEGVRLSVVGADGDGTEVDVAELEGLSDWLRGERELTGRVGMVQNLPQKGQMGTLSDALEVAVGSSGALTALAISLKTWFAQPRRSAFRIRVPVGNDEFVEIDAERAKAGEVESLLVQAMGKAGHAAARQAAQKPEPQPPAPGTGPDRATGSPEAG